MLQAIPRVVGPQDVPHYIVADDIAQLLVKELALLVDHRVVGREVAVALAHHRDRLAPAVQVPQQDFALEVGEIGRASCRERVWQTACCERARSEARTWSC